MNTRLVQRYHPDGVAVWAEALTDGSEVYNVAVPAADHIITIAATDRASLWHAHRIAEALKDATVIDVSAV